MLHACARCGSLSEQKLCPAHRGTQRNGSTRRWRKVRAAVLKRDRYRCHYCGKPATTVDHLNPIARGGEPYDEANLAACCHACNASKGTRTATEYETPI